MSSVLDTQFVTRSLAKRRVLLAAILGAAILSGGIGYAQSPASDPVIVVVNGTEIRESDIRLADEIIGRNMQSSDAGVRREDIITKLIDTVLVSKAATEQKIVDEADLRRRVTFARNQGLMSHLLAAVSAEAVTDKSLREAYDRLIANTPPEPELNLRHIFFKADNPNDEATVKAAEEKAKAAMERITKGEDFAKIAADLSDDPIAKDRGGDFGWRVRAEMGKEYAEAAFKLKTGEVAPIIKTAFGWHIIKLEDKRNRKPHEFETVKDRLAMVLARQAQLTLVTQLRSEAKIERKDKPKEGQ